MFSIWLLGRSKSQAKSRQHQSHARVNGWLMGLVSNENRSGTNWGFGSPRRPPGALPDPGEALMFSQVRCPITERIHSLSKVGMLVAITSGPLQMPEKLACFKDTEHTKQGTVPLQPRRPVREGSSERV